MQKSIEPPAPDAGDARLAAIERLFREQYAPLCRFATHILGDSQRAEEIVDDAMVAIWQRMGVQDARATAAAPADHRALLAKPYVYRTVRNLAVNDLRSAAHARQSATVSPSTMEGLDYLDALFDDRDTPLGQLLLGELSAEMRRAISHLPPDCRRVYLLSRDEALTYQEIAVRTGLSVNTVKYHIKRALALLSTDLDRYMRQLLIAAAISAMQNS